MTLHTSTDAPITCAYWDELVDEDGFLARGRNRYPCKYVVYTDGTNIYAENGDTGVLDYGGPNNRGGVSGVNAAAVIQAALSALTGGSVVVKKGTYTIGATLIPPANVGLFGEAPLNSVIFQTSSDIPIIRIQNNYCSLNNLQLSVLTDPYTSSALLIEDTNPMSLGEFGNLHITRASALGNEGYAIKLNAANVGKGMTFLHLYNLVLLGGFEWMIYGTAIVGSWIGGVLIDNVAIGGGNRNGIILTGPGVISSNQFDQIRYQCSANTVTPLSIDGYRNLIINFIEFDTYLSLTGVTSIIQATANRTALLGCSITLRDLGQYSMIDNRLGDSIGYTKYPYFHMLPMIFDHFFGSALNTAIWTTTLVGTGAAGHIIVAAPTGIGGGIFYAQTGAGGGSTALMNTNGYALVPHPTCLFYARLQGTNPTASARVHIGTRYDATYNSYFEFDTAVSANWSFITTNNAGFTRTPLGIAADTNWHAFKFIYADVGVYVYIDEVLLATVTTNLTTVSQEPYIYVANLAAENKQLLLDYYGHTRNVA